MDSGRWGVARRVVAVRDPQLSAASDRREGPWTALDARRRGSHVDASTAALRWWRPRYDRGLRNCSSRDRPARWSRAASPTACAAGRTGSSAGGAPGAAAAATWSRLWRPAPTPLSSTSARAATALIARYPPTYDARLRGAVCKRSRDYRQRYNRPLGHVHLPNDSPLSVYNDHTVRTLAIYLQAHTGLQYTPKVGRVCI